MIFSRQIAFIDQLESSIFETLRQTINDQGFELEESISEDQLFAKGEDGTGKKLKGYTRTTIRLKLKKGQPVDRTTLRDEREFHPSISIQAFSDRFEVSSNVSHAKWLIKRYGIDILRPNSENLRSFVETNFIPNLKRQFNGQFSR